MKSLGLRIAASSLIVLALSACIDPRITYRRTGAGVRAEAVPKSGEYLVQPGDTLYSIAFRHQLDYRSVAQWNGIADPFVIKVGQRLQLQGTTGTSMASTASTQPPSANPTTTNPSATPANDPNALTMTPAQPVSVPAPPTAVGNSATSSIAGPAVEALPPSGVPVLTSSSGTSKPSTVTPISGAVATGTTTVATTNKPPVVVPPPRSVPSIVANPPAATPAAGSAGKGGWSWPAGGKVISTFAAADPTRQGIDIAGTSGDAVLAARAGEVVYSGRGIIGFGELIVIKHDDSTLSAYGHNRRRLVKEGDRVGGGQQIAEMGKDLRGRDLLHFEVRRNGKPIDPKLVLGAR